MKLIFALNILLFYNIYNILIMVKYLLPNNKINIKELIERNIKKNLTKKYKNSKT